MRMIVAFLSLFAPFGARAYTQIQPGEYWVEAMLIKNKKTPFVVINRGTRSELQIEVHGKEVDKIKAPHFRYARMKLRFRTPVRNTPFATAELLSYKTLAEIKTQQFGNNLIPLK